MASAFTPRAFSRNYYCSPIRYSRVSSPNFFDARMLNSSVGGMYFETQQPLNPGDSIFIKMMDMAPDPYWPEARGAYLAEVRWCEKNDKKSDSPFGIGVRFITNTCTHCGKKIEHKGAGGADLCEKCRRELNPTVTGYVRSHQMGAYVKSPYYF